MGPAGLHHMQLELDATRYILTSAFYSFKKRRVHHKIYQNIITHDKIRSLSADIPPMRNVDAVRCDVVWRKIRS